MRTQVVFPDTTVAFDVGRGLSLAAVERADANEKYVFITRQTDPQKEFPESEDLCRVGTVAVIRQTTRLPGDRVRVFAEGLYRAAARDFRLESGYIYAVTDELETEHGDPTLEEAYFRTAKELVKDILSGESKTSKDLDAALTGVSDPDVYINVCAHQMRLKDVIKQELLEECNLVKRLRLFEQCLNTELEIARLERKIAQDVRRNIDKSIHAELGDEVEENVRLREQIEGKGLPEAVKEKCLQELARMDKMPPSSPEYTVLRNYADWIIDLPWHEETEDTASLADVEKVLNADHYGLEKIKERVVEYLAVLKLTGELKADIRDMEGAAVVRAAYAAQLPVYAVKAISDVAGSGSTTEQYLQNKNAALQSLKAALPAFFEEL